MPLSPEDQEQIRNMGLMTVLAVAFLIMAPLTDQGIGIKEMTAQIKNEEARLATEREAWTDEDIQIGQIPALIRQLEEREPDIKKFEARLPKSRKVPDLFKDIDRFKERSGLDITVQRRLKPVDKEDYVELRIQVEARGDFDSIATFINHLERNQRFAQIRELEITEVPGANTDEDGTPEDLMTHDTQMVISTFMFIDAVEGADGENESS